MQLDKHLSRAPKREKNGKGAASSWDPGKTSKSRSLEEEGRSEFRGQDYVPSAATGHIPSPSLSFRGHKEAVVACTVPATVTDEAHR